MYIAYNQINQVQLSGQHEGALMIVDVRGADMHEHKSHTHNVTNDNVQLCPAWLF